MKHDNSRDRTFSVPLLVFLEWFKESKNGCSTHFLSLNTIFIRYPFCYNLKHCTMHYARWKDKYADISSTHQCGVKCFDHRIHSYTEARQKKNFLSKICHTHYFLKSVQNMRIHSHACKGGTNGGEEESLSELSWEGKKSEKRFAKQPEEWFSPKQNVLEICVWNSAWILTIPCCFVSPHPPLNKTFSGEAMLQPSHALVRGWTPIAFMRPMDICMRLYCSIGP